LHRSSVEDFYLPSAKLGDARPELLKQVIPPLDDFLTERQPLLTGVFCATCLSIIVFRLYIHDVVGLPHGNIGIIAHLEVGVQIIFARFLRWFFRFL